MGILVILRAHPRPDGWPGVTFSLPCQQAGQSGEDASRGRSSPSGAKLWGGEARRLRRTVGSVERGQRMRAPLWRHGRAQAAMGAGAAGGVGGRVVGGSLVLWCVAW